MVVAGYALEHMASPGASLERAMAECCAQVAASMVDRQPAAALRHQSDDTWLLDQSALMRLIAAK